MRDHLSTERLHDLLDGLLSPEEEVRARAHLETCTKCRTEHEALAGLLADLGALRPDARAPGGLWAGIEARITAGIAVDGSTDRAGGDETAAPEVASILDLPTERVERRRRFSFTVPQLAAAAVIVCLVSAGGMWTALSRFGTADRAPVATAAPGREPGTVARMAASGDVAYDEALLELQTLVDQGRDVLAPETVETLDRSLKAIDDAIADIRGALAKDPSSELLTRMLINQQRTKLRVLRQAAVAMQARS